MGRNHKITNIGDIFKTRTGDLRVINYISAKEILVEFIDGKSSPFWAHIGNLRKGKYKNKYYPDVCGVGYVGEGASSSDNKQAYKNWQYLLSRVCSPVQHLRRASSKELTIQPSWLCFQEYLKWHNINYIEGFELDKDILVLGNTLYSEDTCCFIPRELNTKFPKRTSKGDRVYNILNSTSYQTTLNNITKTRVNFISKNRQLCAKIKSLDTRLMLFRLLKKYPMLPVKVKIALLKYRGYTTG